MKEHVIQRNAVAQWFVVGQWSFMAHRISGAEPDRVAEGGIENPQNLIIKHKAVIFYTENLFMYKHINVQFIILKIWV